MGSSGSHETEESDADRFYERVQALMFLLLEEVSPFRLREIVALAATMSPEQYQSEVTQSKGLVDFATSLALLLLDKEAPAQSTRRDSDS